MMGHFVEVCRRIVKVSADKSKVMVLNVEECEVCVDGMQLEDVSDFKYLGCISDESGTDGPEYSRKVASGRRIGGEIRSLDNCSLNVLKSCRKHCLYMLLRMAVKQCYGRRRKDLELGLYRWTTSEVC